MSKIKLTSEIAIIERRKNSIKHTKKDLFRMTYFKVFLIFILSILLYIFTNLTTIDVVIILFSVIVILWNIKSQVSLIVATLLFTLTIVLLTVKYFGNSNIAEVLAGEVAVATYCFLLIGIIKQIWDIILENKTFRFVETTPISIPSYNEHNEPKAQSEKNKSTKKLYAKHDIVIKKRITRNFNN